jgi:topoisomerase-4 subunit A
VTVVVSTKGWIRALRGHVTDLSGVTFKAGDELQFAFPTETVAKALLFASNGRFYTIDVSKLPGGRGFGEPVRLYADMEQDASIVAAMAYVGGRKFLVASREGNGFVVAEDECLATTRKGKTVLNLKNYEARALTVVTGELVASIGENRKMLIFPIADVPEMARGRGVRLQRYKEKGLSDVTTFKASDGLSWYDAAGRTFSTALKDLRDWRGKRADAGRIAPKGFPKNNKFGTPGGNDKGEGRTNS